MKKNLFYYLFAVLCTVSLFTSCSDDDDSSTNPDSIEKLVGNYKGVLDVYYVLDGGDQLIASDLSQKVYVTKVSETAVKLELRNFVFSLGESELSLGNITVDNCLVTQKGETYTFSGNQNLTLLAVGECAVTVSGTVDNGTIKMIINVVVGDGTMKVKVDCEGTKLAGTESSEAKITNFTFNSEFVTVQPTINDETGTITFRVNDEATSDILKTLIPTFTISDKATVFPASGIAQDFSNGKTVIYTVTAEDGTTKKYSVSIGGTNNIMKFSFEEWQSVGVGVTKHEEPLPSDILASSAQGASLLGVFGWKGGFPVEKTEDAKEGTYAVKLITLDTHEIKMGAVPALTAGSLFTGTFDTTPAITGDQLSCTKFGIAYNNKPLMLKGWYKYTPGETYMDGTDKNNITYPEGTDECSIQGILYEAVDAENQPITLTGHNINDSEYRVAVATLADGSAKADYTYFELPFTFLKDKLYDPNKKYKLAIICSSSKNGDKFIGAEGSTLIIDALEVIGE